MTIKLRKVEDKNLFEQDRTTLALPEKPCR